jgi:hypothetical protein
VAAKQARLSQNPPLGKRARYESAEPTRQAVSWRFNEADIDGPFRWDAISSQAIQMVVRVMVTIDRKQWTDASGEGMGKIKGIPLNRLSPAALQRLRAIKKDDLDKLYEIHLGAASPACGGSNETTRSTSCGGIPNIWFARRSCETPRPNANRVGITERASLPSHSTT